MENETDYNKLDHDRIIEYMRQNNGVADVADLITDSGANRLRIYPLLAQMSLDKEIVIEEESFWGAPVKVRLS